jgi:hypothetical protein
MRLPLARRVCDAVEIRAGREGTTILLRMGRADQGWAEDISNRFPV